MMAESCLKPKKGEGNIHSGQFMKSKIFTEPDEEDEYIDICANSDPEDEPASIKDTHRQRSSTVCSREDLNPAPDDNDPTNRDEKPVTFYKFGPRQTRSIAIDVSLNQLNNCIHQAYSKLTTPKWKDFKGMRLRWKQRIRLNNVIWRAWHMEFVDKRKTQFCFFTVPSEDQHNRYEAAILEGMYWKRRLETVASQYHRWRIDKARGKRQRRHYSRDSLELRKTEGIFVRLPPRTRQSLTPQADPPVFALFDDDMANPFTDRLFESLNLPYEFPDPKEMAQAGKADFIQPSLLQLQPSLEEIMQSLDANYPIMTNDDPELSSYSHQTHMEQSESALSMEHDTYMQPRLPEPSNFLMMESCSEASIMQPDSTLEPNLQNPSGPRGLAEIPSVTAQPSLLYSQPAAYDSPVSFMSESSSGLSTEPYVPQGSVPSREPCIVGGKMSVRNWIQGNTETNLSDVSYGNRIVPPSKGALKAYPEQIPRDAKRQKRTKREDTHGSLFKRKKPVESVRVSTSDQLQFMRSPEMGNLGQTHQVFGSAFSPIAGGFSAGRIQSTGMEQTVLRAPLTESSPSLAHLRSPGVHQPFFSQSTSTQHPFLIVQPCSSVQLPLAVALPYSSMAQLPTVGSGTATVKQESEKLPVSPYQASSYTSKSPNVSLAPSEPKYAKRVAADSTVDPNERKRMLHLHAEQSRRSALKGGFEQLEELLPNLQPTATKPTNAVVLGKAADYVRDLQQECEKKQSDVGDLNKEIGQLNEKIRAYQTHLPTSGNSRAAARAAMQQMFASDVKQRSEGNWKFWLFSKLMEPLFENYKNEIEGTNSEELTRSVREWASRQCHLVKLRPVASDVLVSLAADTPLMSDPQSFPDYVRKQIE